MTRRLLLSMFLRCDTAVFLICICFFLIWPRFDLYVSEYFYDQNSGGFSLGQHVFADSIYSLTNMIGLGIVIALPLMITSSYLLKNEFLAAQKKSCVFLLSVCLLGPGLMVNTVLKDNWSRPRPRQVIDFGGSKVYESPFSPSFECEKCHSFVSGHASVGFFFFGLALLLSNRKWLLLPCIAGGVIGAVRIVQGGHFFSDVVFSGWVVWFCARILYTLFYEYAIFQKKVAVAVETAG